VYKQLQKIACRALIRVGHVEVLAVGVGKFVTGAIAKSRPGFPAAGAGRRFFLCCANERSGPPSAGENSPGSRGSAGIVLCRWSNWREEALSPGRNFWWRRSADGNFPQAGGVEKDGGRETPQMAQCCRGRQLPPRSKTSEAWNLACDGQLQKAFGLGSILRETARELAPIGCIMATSWVTRPRHALDLGGGILMAGGLYAKPSAGAGSHSI